MRIRSAILGMALAALLLAAGASATAPRTVQLKIGDAVDVAGTRVACFALKSNGKQGIGCVLWKGHAPLAGSFGAGLAVDGTAVLNRIKADGSSKVVTRRPQSVGSASKVYELHVGDAFGIPIDNRISLGCKIIDVTSKALAPVYRGVKTSCWRATASAPLPKTWGISISDKFAGLFQFDSRGKVSANGVPRAQPR